MRAAWEGDALIPSLVSSVIFSIEASKSSYIAASFKSQRAKEPKGWDLALIKKPVAI